MKKVHIGIAVALLVYTVLNIPKLGVGEVLSVVFFTLTLLIGALVFKKDLTGKFLAGIIAGITVEWITEAYWEYNMKVYVWRDISLFVVIGWGYSITVFTILSDTLSKCIYGLKNIQSTDRRILVTDAFLGPVWFLLNEFFGMKILHLWTYSSFAHWDHMVPVINYPAEGIVGACMFGMVFPSFVRHWGKQLQYTPVTEEVLSGKKIVSGNNLIQKGEA